jgi:hypothetical protein
MLATFNHADSRRYWLGTPVALREVASDLDRRRGSTNGSGRQTAMHVDSSLGCDAVNQLAEKEEHMTVKSVAR